MLALTLGPLAFPVPPLVALAALLLAVAVARWRAGAAFKGTAETSLWLAAAAGFGAARLAHVLRHAGAYAEAPLSALDVRDGGFMASVGFAVAAVVLLVRADRAPATRRALAQGAGSGVLLWALLSGAVQLAQPPADVRALPPVALRPLAAGQGVQPLPALFDGRPVVVNLWATWCGPCRAEMPVLAEAQRRHPQVRFVFANQGEVPEVVTAFLRAEGLMLHDVWLDIGSALGPALGSRGLPTTVFFDAQGRRVDAHLGLLNEAALRARLSALGVAPASAAVPSEQLQ